MDTEYIRLSLKKLHACIVIPTYNNAGTVQQVVAEALSCCEDVLVVNDGSTDNTSDLLHSFDSKPHIIEYSPNRGKGFALRTAFKEATKMGFDYAITIDSDGQHDIREIPKFVELMQQHPNALIVGSRSLHAPNMPSQNTFANKFSNFWFTVQTAHKLPDTQSGYRVYPLQKIGKMHFYTRRYETELEILVRSAWKGIPLLSIPIQVYYPPQEERVSHFRPRIDFSRISILNTFLCLFAIIYGYPSMLFHKLFPSR